MKLKNLMQDLSVILKILSLLILQALSACSTLEEQNKEQVQTRTSALFYVTDERNYYEELKLLWLSDETAKKNTEE